MRGARLVALAAGIVIILVAAVGWGAWTLGLNAAKPPAQTRAAQSSGPPSASKAPTTPPSASASAPTTSGASSVSVVPTGEDSFQYLVNGQPQVFIGMGYNPIYRYLSDQARVANYDRDFRTLCRAGVNTILGWDADKGYEQDKFDEITLDQAQKYGIGVVMPFVLPFDGNYQDESFRQNLLEEAAAKVNRFKDHPALRMWGVGNELLHDGLPVNMLPAFSSFYLQLADMIHSLDPNHPVIYRESADFLFPAGVRFVKTDSSDRPWLLFGMNVYTMDLEQILDDWPYYGFDRPLFVTEFGAEPSASEGRAIGYLDMWRMIRAHPDYVMGGAPYAWTVAGPEPTDEMWGLMDANGHPVDDTFRQLRADWLKEPGARRSCP